MASRLETDDDFEKMVSIILTTFNRRDLLLSRSLPSALNQTYKDYEIIVCDDGDCGELKDDRVRYFKNTCKGVACNRNFGIKKARGEYIVCLDDDNELCPTFLEETISYIEGHNLDAVGTARVIQYKDFAHTVVPKLSKFTSMDWGWLIRREVFDVIQYDENCKANEDADFGIQFGKRFTRTVIDEPLCVAYDEFGDPTKSTSFPSKRELDGMIYFLNKNLKEYDDPNELRYLYRLAGRKFYRGGHRLKGLGYFWKSFFAHPRLNSFAHLIFIHFGWFVYNEFMTLTEKHQ